MLVCVCFVHLAHETAGAARTRSSLRPPIFWGRHAWQTSGASRRENAELRPHPRCHRPRKRTIQYSEAAVIEPISRGVLDTPWVHDASATPARVLWRWDNVMASSALKSALRFTACMQAVNLKRILRRCLAGRRRRSVGSCGAIPGVAGSGTAATCLSGPSNWPSVDDVWTAA